MTIKVNRKPAKPKKETIEIQGKTVSFRETDYNSLVLSTFRHNHRSYIFVDADQIPEIIEVLETYQKESKDVV